MEQSTRVARTQARKKARARAAREEKLKVELTTAIGGPLRNAISDQAQSVADVSRQLRVTGSDLLLEVRQTTERMAHLENKIEAIVKEKVGSAMAIFGTNKDLSPLNLERKIIDTTRELCILKDICHQDREKHRLDVKTLEDKMSSRMQSVEYTARDLKETKEKLHKVSTDFEKYTKRENLVEAYARRLEVCVKDMEIRLWPWRQNMDRSNSPPPQRSDSPPGQEDTTADWQPPNMNEWPSTSAGKTASSAPQGASPRPTPPPTRPSSAPFRGRDPGFAGVRTGSFNHTTTRPSSASSVR